MRKTILALALTFAVSPAFAYDLAKNDCDTDSDCVAMVKAGGKPVNPAGDDYAGAGKKRDNTTIKACGVAWKAAKADADVKAKGWPAYWSACAKAHKIGA